MGGRSFSVAAALLWNKLPTHLQLCGFNEYEKYNSYYSINAFLFTPHVFSDVISSSRPKGDDGALYKSIVTSPLTVQSHGAHKVILGAK